MMINFRVAKAGGAIYGENTLFIQVPQQPNLNIQNLVHIFAIFTVIIRTRILDEIQFCKKSNGTVCHCLDGMKAIH